MKAFALLVRSEQRDSEEWIEQLKRCDDYDAGERYLVACNGGGREGWQTRKALLMSFSICFRKELIRISAIRTGAALLWHQRQPLTNASARFPIY
jgi:hypothetical protein